MSTTHPIATAGPATPSSKTSKSKPKDSKLPSLASSNPSDTFTQQTKLNQERHLRMEQAAQLQAQEQLHKARVQALFAQLHTQLFTIWNEIWMQRRKAHDEAFKAWMKIIVA